MDYASYIFMAIMLVMFIVVVTFLGKSYHKPTKDRVFLRTGPGEKVVMRGGAFVFPIIHAISWVSLRTVTLEIERKRQESLITNDKLKVDVDVKFYVRVQPDENGVSTAIATLGEKVSGSGTAGQALKDLVEGKLVDALRNVAAKNTLEELHSNRDEFVRVVREVASNELAENGLLLESVSLNSLTQTSKEYFDPENGLDAEGLKRLTEQTESARLKTNEIEQDTRVKIEQKNLEASRQTSEVARETAQVEADTATKIAHTKAKAEESSRKAEIESEKSVQATEIERDQFLAEAQEKSSRAKQQAIIERERDIEISNQAAAIAVSERVKEKSEAETAANEARAKEVESSEKVKTTQAIAEGERNKQVEVLEAATEAEKEAERTRILAKASREAAVDEAEGQKLLIEVEERRYSVQASGEKALNEAKNVLGSDWVDLQAKEALLKSLPAILAESAKAIQNVDSVKLVQMVGGPAGSGAGNSAGIEGNGSMADQFVNAIQKQQLMSPMISELLKSANIDSLSDLSGSLMPKSNAEDGVSGAGDSGEEVALPDSQTDFQPDALDISDGQARE